MYYAMHSQCTAPNHVYKDVDTGQVASDLVSCIGIQPPDNPFPEPPQKPLLLLCVPIRVK
jgi:hypothetical protein